eukprot:CAMPEP_0205909480 /NCGR_PEP_ID=MMETSP1325-20131115/3899_1 /ASSEMBLY_ACC=CAM_ASM_000708 /TAXON_ID=236786 /ORGANISM="Florenciella sp., Strain RCC1007" /LENGTH=49 /DNA_ID=CAMNT_0053275771 /DNA_START=302 /DNA_END=451 /DNA_ORIENTATION=+
MAARSFPRRSSRSPTSTVFAFLSRYDCLRFAITAESVAESSVGTSEAWA